MPGPDELSSTLERSDDKAKRTWIKAHDSAVDSYGEGERAHRTAFAAVKHTHEKVGDHWEPKEQSGPPDKQGCGTRGARDATQPALAGSPRMAAARDDAGHCQGKSLRRSADVSTADADDGWGGSGTALFCYACGGCCAHPSCAPTASSGGLSSGWSYSSSSPVVVSTM